MGRRRRGERPAIAVVNCSVALPGRGKPKVPCARPAGSPAWRLSARHPFEDVDHVGLGERSTARSAAKSSFAWFSTSMTTSSGTVSTA